MHEPVISAPCVRVSIGMAVVTAIPSLLCVVTPRVDAEQILAF